MSDAIHYYAETVKPGYAILRRDIVVDGEVIESIDLGSPAPTEIVKPHEKTIHFQEFN